MSVADALLPEYNQEMPRTRRMLERVPQDKLEWRPHEKSMPLGRLASHLAELPGWAAMLLERDEYDIAASEGDGPDDDRGPLILDSVDAILELFDENVESTRERISATSDDRFMSMWTLKYGGEEVFTLPRVGVLRSMLLNHMIHHRGQLSVFLRLLDVPVPQTYGPTADEQDV